MQNAAHILMVRPGTFGFNLQTSKTNKFQKAPFPSKEKTYQKAIQEFDQFVLELRKERIGLSVFQDPEDPICPDAVFPNNWISLHEDGTVILYPMLAPNRRKERKPEILGLLRQEGFQIRRVIDLSHYEEKNKFLEGTGSLVFDRENRLAFACLSPRTDPELLGTFANLTGYKIIAFPAQDSKGIPIYHTNVLISIGDCYTVLCLEAIRDPQSRELVLDSLLRAGKGIITITVDQMVNFAANILQVRNYLGEKIIIMSLHAFQSMSPDQIRQISSYGKILHPILETIENVGGGGARCMMAEVFLPKGKEF